MEKILNLARGCVLAEISGTGTEEVMNLCAARGIRFWKAERLDAYTLRLKVYSRDYPALESAAVRVNCDCIRISEQGLPRTLHSLRLRFVLYFGLVLVMALFVWSSLHIWEIEVIGNEKVSEWEIISALEEAGVGIGSYWPTFTSDNIRSLVLVQIPELSWITVNVSGSRAEVIVRERKEIPEVFDETFTCDIIAEKPGIIISAGVLRGQSMTAKGQTVAAGDTLVSGAVASSYSPLRFVHSRAEIYARTWYTLTLQKPLETTKKTEILSTDSSFALILGDKRINFYKSSGIFTPDCDKITLDHYLSVDGAFYLPVGISQTRTVSYATCTGSIDAAAAQAELKQELYDELLARIGSTGSVTSFSYASAELDGVLTVTLRAECVEQIGTERPLSEEEMQRLRENDTNDKTEGET